MDYQDEMTARDRAERSEIPDGVVRRRDEIRNDHMRDEYREQGVAIRCRLRHDFGADDGVASRARLDNDRLAPALGKLGPDEASQYVGGATRRVGADDANRLRRIDLLGDGRRGKA